MTRHEVAIWLRQEAGKLLAAAQALDEPAKPVTDDIRIRTRPPQTVTPEKVRERLRRGSSRIPHLAKEFNTDQQTLLSIILNPENGIVRERRGWLKLRESLNGG